MTKLTEAEMLTLWEESNAARPVPPHMKAFQVRYKNEENTGEDSGKLPPRRRTAKYRKCDKSPFPERNAKIIQMTEAGFGPTEIAGRLGITKNTVSGVLERTRIAAEQDSVA